MVGVGLWIEGETTVGQRLVTGGVAMEVICAWWVLIASRKLQNILETEFETLRLETARANERAEKAASAVAESNRLVAEANLEVARLTLEIEKMRAPRVFTPEQRANLVAQLKLPRVPDWMREWGVEVIIDNDDQEARSFGEQLSADLKRANWNVRTQPNPNRLAMTGVVIEMNAGFSERLMTHADKLVAALRSEGISVNDPNVFNTNDLYPTIRIRVGRKP